MKDEPPRLPFVKLMVMLAALNIGMIYVLPRLGKPIEEEAKIIRPVAEIPSPPDFINEVSGETRIGYEHMESYTGYPASACVPLMSDLSFHLRFGQRSDATKDNFSSLRDILDSFDSEWPESIKVSTYFAENGKYSTKVTVSNSKENVALYLDEFSFSPYSASFAVKGPGHLAIVAGSNEEFILNANSNGLVLYTKGKRQELENHNAGKAVLHQGYEMLCSLRSWGLYEKTIAHWLAGGNSQQ